MSKRKGGASSKARWGRKIGFIEKMKNNLAWKFFQNREDEKRGPAIAELLHFVMQNSEQISVDLLEAATWVAMNEELVEKIMGAAPVEQEERRKIEKHLYDEQQFSLLAAMLYCDDVAAGKYKSKDLHVQSNNQSPKRKVDKAPFQLAGANFRKPKGEPDGSATGGHGKTEPAGKKGATA